MRLNKLKMAVLLSVGLSVVVACGRGKSDLCRQCDLFEPVGEEKVADWQDTTSNYYKTTDGYTLIHTIGSAPMNERIEILAPDGKQVVVAGLASEAAGFNFVRFDYSGGRLSGFTAYPGESTIDEELARFDEDMCERFGDDCNVQALKRSALCDAAPESAYDHYELVYDKGVIREVQLPREAGRIVAPEGGCIEYEVSAEEAFWMNDLWGGGVELRFRVKDSDGKVLQQYLFGNPVENDKNI